MVDVDKCGPCLDKLPMWLWSPSLWHSLIFPQVLICRNPKNPTKPYKISTPPASGMYSLECIPVRLPVSAADAATVMHDCALQAFDYDTGRPKRYVEMLSWPRAHKLHRALPTVLAGVFWESFVPTKAAATMRMVLNRSVSGFLVQSHTLVWSSTGLSQAF